MLQTSAPSQLKNIPSKVSKRRWFTTTSAETRCVSPAEEAETGRGFGEEEDEGEG